MSNEIYVAESSIGVLGVYTVLELALINHNVTGVTISKHFKKNEHQYKKIENYLEKERTWLGVYE